MVFINIYIKKVLNKLIIKKNKKLTKWDKRYLVLKQIKKIKLNLISPKLNASH